MLAIKTALRLQRPLNERINFSLLFIANIRNSFFNCTLQPTDRIAVFIRFIGTGLELGHDPPLILRINDHRRILLLKPQIL